MERNPDSNEGKAGVGFPLHYNIRGGSEWYDGVARYIVVNTLNLILARPLAGKSLPSPSPNTLLTPWQAYDKLL